MLIVRPFKYSGGGNTVKNSNGSPLLGFPTVFGFRMVFQFEHFAQNHWKSEQNGGHFVQISIGSVLEWSGA